MIPLDMLNIRDKIELALAPLEWQGSSAGVAMINPPSADIEGCLDGYHLIITITVKSAIYEGQPMLASRQGKGKRSANFPPTLPPNEDCL